MVIRRVEITSPEKVVIFSLNNFPLTFRVGLLINRVEVCGEIPRDFESTQKMPFPPAH